MRTQKLFICTLISLLSCLAQASAPAIKIAFVVGKVTFTVGEETKAASIGKVVPQHALLHIHKSAQLVLKDAKNRYCILETVDVDKKVKYAELDGIFKAQEKAGLMNSIIDFMAKELKSEHYNVRDYASDNLKKKGGVTRDGCSYPLMLYPGTNQQVSDSLVQFKWAKEGTEEAYWLEIYFGDEYNGETVKTLFSQQVSDTFCSVPLSAFRAEYADQSISWVAYPTSYRRNCARYYFVLISPAKRQELINQVEQELKDIKDPEDKLSQKAFLLEDKGLMNEADGVYRELIAKYNKKIYTDLYHFFQLRNGLYAG